MTQLFSSWHWYGVNLKSKMFGECLVHAIVWGIWKEMNNRIFQNSSKNTEEVIEAIIRKVESWLYVTAEFKDLFL